MDERKNTGSLRRNAKREKETQPSHRGSCEIHGVKFWISAWVNEDRVTKEKYFRLVFEERKDDGKASRGEGKPETGEKNKEGEYVW